MSEVMSLCKTRYKFPKGFVPWNKGLSAETSEKIRETLEKGLFRYVKSPEGRKKSGEILRVCADKFWSSMSAEERQVFIEKRAEKIKKSWENPETIEKHKQGMKLMHQRNPKLRELSAERMRRRHADPEKHRHMLEQLDRGREIQWADPEYIKKFREGRTRSWADSKKRERWLKNTLKGARKRPTNLERKVIEAIELYSLPYKYTGNGAFIIGGKNPDFVNTDGKKRLVEVNGEYWHSKNEAEKRIKAFAEYGFETLILWGVDLMTMDSKQIADAISGEWR